MKNVKCKQIEVYSDDLDDGCIEKEIENFCNNGNIESIISINIIYREYYNTVIYITYTTNDISGAVL